MKTILLFLFTFVSFTILHAQTVTTLHIDPDVALGGTTSQIFDSVRFIPLETNKESLFGRISQLEVTEKYFIIEDPDTQAILIFDKSGKFHAKFKQRTDAEYLGPFTLNRSANEIIVNSADGKALIFDYDGKFLTEQTIPQAVGGIFYFNQHAVAYNINRPDKAKKGSDKYDLIYSDGFNHITKQLLPYNPKNEILEYNMIGQVFNSEGADGTSLFAFPYSYTISQLSNAGIVHQYKMIFPTKYSLPANFATDSIFTGKRIAYVLRDHSNNGKFYDLTRFYKDRDYLIFHIYKIGGAVTYTDNLFYNLKTTNLYSFERITGDSTSSLIPILDAQSAESICSVYNGHLYTSIPAFMLFGYKEYGDKKIKYSPQLEAFFSKWTKKDNPVIIESHLKDNL